MDRSAVLPVVPSLWVLHIGRSKDDTVLPHPVLCLDSPAGSPDPEHAWQLHQDRQAHHQG